MNIMERKKEIWVFCTELRRMCVKLFIVRELGQWWKGQPGAFFQGNCFQLLSTHLKLPEILIVLHTYSIENVLFFCFSTLTGWWWFKGSLQLNSNWSSFCPCVPVGSWSDHRETKVRAWYSSAQNTQIPSIRFKGLALAPKP